MRWHPAVNGNGRYPWFVIRGSGPAEYAETGPPACGESVPDDYIARWNSER